MDLQQHDSLDQEDNVRSARRQVGNRREVCNPGGEKGERDREEKRRPRRLPNNKSNSYKGQN